MKAVMIVHVFLVQRKQDREPWPCVYHNHELAAKALGRVSPVISLSLTRVNDHRLLETGLAATVIPRCVDGHIMMREIEGTFCTVCGIADYQLLVDKEIDQ